jgi:hypothetical protein
MNKRTWMPTGSSLKNGTSAYDQSPAGSAGYSLVFTAAVKSVTPNYAFVEIVKELPRSLIGKRVKIEITEIP